MYIYILTLLHLRVDSPQICHPANLCDARMLGMLGAQTHHVALSSPQRISLGKSQYFTNLK